MSTNSHRARLMFVTLTAARLERSLSPVLAELCRTGLVTRTQLETRPYLALRRAWGEYVRLREERARLKVLVAHQLYGLLPEFLRVWADLLQPGALAVLRT